MVQVGPGGGAGGGGGATAQVYTPAVALFEHPEDATTLFPAGTGAEGLTVTLREPLEYGQDTSQWSIVGAQRYQGVPGTAAVAATADFLTRSVGGVDGGLRVTASPAGADGNDYTIRMLASNVHGIAYTAASQLFVVTVPSSATAQEVRDAFNADSANRGFQMAYYGNETGASVIVTSGGTLLTGLGNSRSFTGGADAIDEVPADPVHVVVDSDNMRLTAYYNLASGGVLTAADTLGDLKGAFDTAGEGLSSAYVGGGDADTDMTRPFAAVNTFSAADLRGLRLMLTAPLAAGAAGNAFGLVARARFPGGGEVTERQAHILVYTDTGRTGGVRVTLDADIQGLNEHGAPVDVSSGALGNEWHFVTRTGTGNAARVSVSSANRQIIFESNQLGLDDATGSQVLDACNQGGTGCSATTFGGYVAARHVFRGSLGDLNASISGFHGGRDYHAATSNPEPILVTAGPTHAHTRLYTTPVGGIELRLTDPAHDGGNGYTFEASEGDPLAVTVTPTQERIDLTIPSAGALASAILAAFNADAALEAVYFGTEDGTTPVMASRFGRHELLGGLDATEVEIRYAPTASGGISSADTMGAVKTVWDDAAAGRRSFYYGGADANTVASRLVPWEHEFEDGVTDTISLAGFGLGPETNEFTGADRAAAEAARDAYATANPTWVEAYRGQLRVWIALRWGTAPGMQIGQTLRANASNPPVAGDWTDQNIALRGEEGQKGDKGDAGQARTDADINTLIDARLQTQVKDYARTGGPLIMPADAASTFMLDSELTSNAIIALISGNIAFGDISGMIADGQVPASFMRDAEFTRAAIATLLGITNAQVGEILVGNPTISGQTLTFTRADGTTVDIAIPAGMSGGTADGRLRFGVSTPASSLGIDGDSYVFVDMTERTAAFYEKASGAWTEKFKVDLAAQADDHTRRGAISTDTTLEQAEFDASTTSTTGDVTIPTWSSGTRYVFLGVPEDEDDITDIRQSGISEFNQWERVTGVHFQHKWWRTSDAVTVFGSGRTYTIIQ